MKKKYRRRRQMWEYAPEAQKAALLALRETFPRAEEGLVGWEEIAAWFVRIRYTDVPPAKSTLQKWSRRWFMPVDLRRATMKSLRRTAFTTNLMLHAWLLSQGGRMHVPRWHPAYVPAPPLSRRTGQRRRAQRLANQAADAAQALATS